MSVSDCQEKITHTRIKVEENGRSAIFKNDERREYMRTRIDGCAMTGQPACDWALSLESCGDVLIELKGKDVNHATEQISNTAEFWRNGGHSNGKLAGLIVCRQYPRIDTTVQRAKQILANRYRAPLHVISWNATFEFEKVLSFRGPL